MEDSRRQYNFITSAQRLARRPAVLLRRFQGSRLVQRYGKYVLLVLATALVSLPAVFVNNVFGYLPGIILILMVGISYGYLLLIRRCIRYEELSDLSGCQRGTAIEFKVRLENRSILVMPRVQPWFYISDLFGGTDQTMSEVISLAPREQREFSFSVRFDHIGSYSAGLKRIQVEDLLGLFTKTIENENQYTVQVTPRIFDVSRITFSNANAAESRRATVRSMLESNDYTGVREYVIGDPMKNIHWKLSARTEGYLTKQYETYSNTGIAIVLDLQAPAADPETMMGLFDSIVETALSLEAYAEEQGLDHELVFYDRQQRKNKRSIRGESEYMDLIRRLPRITAQPQRADAVQLVREEGNAMYAQGNILLCSARITPQTAEALISIRARRKHPMLFAAVPALQTEAQQQALRKPLQMLERHQIPYYLLPSAQELEGRKL